MAEHHIGLDIGSFAVRAAEVSGEPGSLTLHRFAQLTLPAGAVVDGEIMDPPAVSAAIKALWEKGGFRTKKVVVGIGNRWVKVRQAEVPALPHEDVRSSLRYGGQEGITFGDDDAVVDFVVQDRFQGPEGGDFLRILVVAAQRQMVSTTLSTVRQAGLVAELVDLTPFALVRALAPAAPAGVSEAIVSVGAGLTNVVVHTGGTPRLARMTPRAGGAVTENLTRTLGVDARQAEALKRGASAVAVADPHTAQAADVIASELNPLVQEIQGSLDYFLAQTDDVDLRRVLLTGAGSKMAGLRNRLATELRVPVEMGSPLEYLRLGKTGLSNEQLAAAAAVMAAPVGLAMAPMASPATKLTSLFPVEFNEADNDRRYKVAAAAAVGALAVVLTGAWGLRLTQVTQTHSRTERAEKAATTLNTQVQKLLPFEVAEAEVNAKRNQIQVALARDVDMVALLDGVTAALPDEVGATSIVVTTGAAGGAAAGPTASAAATFGTVTIAGLGKTQDSAAHWITRMRELNVLSGVWVPSSTKTAATTGAAGGTTFSGSADLTPKAGSGRADNFKAGQ